MGKFAHGKKIYHIIRYMKTLSLFLALGVACSAGAVDWENPRVFAEGRLAPRATFYPYATAQQAVDADVWNSPRITSLNGEWAFRYSPNPESRPADFFKSGYDVSGWDRIEVPSNW